MQYPTICFFTLFFLVGCAQESSYLQSAYSLEARFGQRIRNEFNLSPYGYGGSFNDKIRLIDIDFASNERINIEEARILIVTLGGMLLNEINDDPKIRHELNHYPFNVEDIAIGLLFNQGFEDSTQKRYLASVILVNGKIRYSVYSKEQDCLVELLSESFEEASHKFSQPK